MSEEKVRSLLHRVKETLQSADSRDDLTSSFLSVSTAARYLRAYKDEAKAAKNMVATYEYQKLVRADTIGTNPATHHIIWRELQKRSMFIGAVSDGNTPSSPIVVLRKKAERFEAEDFEDYRSAFFFTLACVAEIADRQLGMEDPLKAQCGQWFLVMDMNGYSSKNSPPLNVSMETMRIFQNHFPERAKKIVIVDAPMVFTVLWKAIKPFIDPVTRPKFAFVSRSDGEEELKRRFGETFWECLNVELEEAKRSSAQLMVDQGLLLPEDGSSAS